MVKSNNVNSLGGSRTMCQIITILSSPPDASQRPLFDHRTEFTQAGWNKDQNRKSQKALFHDLIAEDWDVPK